MLGWACTGFQFANLQYHLYFFVRYFMLDFAQKEISPAHAVIMLIIGFYFLIRINLLLMLTVTTSAGSIKYVKEKRRGLDRSRLTKLKSLTFNQ
jgi:hypothetical protein